MKTKTFIKKKNKIVKKVTGITLVPEDQIIDEPKVMLGYFTSFYLDSSVCPYCVSRRKDNINIDCTTCPMSLAGNKCEANENSTWNEANTIWGREAKKKDIKKLSKLIKKYNKGQEE